MAAANKLGKPRPLRPGERLRVPVGREVTAVAGDTFESLAATYLGSARRATFLAELNGGSGDDSLAAGAVITIPFAVTHTAASPESLQEISRQYYGDPRSAELLRRYNMLDKNAIDRGESLLVPGLKVRTTPGKIPPLEPESRARRDHLARKADPRDKVPLESPGRHLDALCPVSGRPLDEGVAAIPFVIGWSIAGPVGVREGTQTQYERTVACLPAADQAALDGCLNGGQ